MIFCLFSHVDPTRIKTDLSRKSSTRLNPFGKIDRSSVTNEHPSRSFPRYGAEKREREGGRGREREERVNVSAVQRAIV